MSYGLGCFNEKQCRNEIVADTQEAVEIEANREGWMLGLLNDGQAYYACAGCAPCLFKAYPAYPDRNRESLAANHSGDKA